MNVLPTLAIGPIVAVVLEGLKYLLRMLKKDPTMDFTPNFYKVIIPVLNVLALPVAALLSPFEFEMPTDWYTFGRLLVITIINSISAVITYNAGIAPSKVAFKAKRAEMDKSETYKATYK